MRRGQTQGPRVTAIRTYAVTLPLRESLSTSQTRYQSREYLLVELETENGVSGWGECAGPPALITPILHSFFREFLLGQDALQTDRIWHTLWREMFRWGRRGLMVSALSGVDMALWDIKGKLLKRPCSEMMGGRAVERVPIYATGLLFRDRPEAELIPALIEEAQGYLEAGYRGVKAQIGRNLSFDLSLIRRLRENLPNAILMADAGHAYDLPEAIQIAMALSEARYAWLEDPLSPEFPEQNRALSERVPILLAAGEWEQTRFGFQRLFQAGGITHAQVNIAFCGGPTEALRIRGIAESFGINMTPVGTGSMLNAAAAVHFAVSTFRLPGRLEPLVQPIGWPVSLDGLPAQTFAQGITIDHGMVVVPRDPGWGVTIDRSVLTNLCATTGESHL